MYFKFLQFLYILLEAKKKMIPSTSLKISAALSLVLSSQQARGADPLAVSILQKRKLRLREVK